MTPRTYKENGLNSVKYVVYCPLKSKRRFLKCLFFLNPAPNIPLRDNQQGLAERVSHFRGGLRFWREKSLGFVCVVMELNPQRELQ